MKKQISLWLAVIMLFGTITTFAQKPFAGTITFSWSAEGTDDPNITAQLAELSQEVILLGNSTKTVINQMGVRIINITNGDYKLVTTVIDIPGYGKYYVEQDENEVKKRFETTKMDFNYTEETKTIAGYNCKKVVLKTTDLETDEEDEAVLWVTSELMTGEYDLKTSLQSTRYPLTKNNLGYKLGKRGICCNTFVLRPSCDIVNFDNRNLLVAFRIAQLLSEQLDGGHGINAEDVSEITSETTGINLAKLAIRYSDGVITAADGVNGCLEAYAKEKNLPIITSPAISTENTAYIDEYEKFYDQILA